jgi:hypothetical protein
VSIDPEAPEHDGRVVWLIDQIGGSAEISHRREDILRAGLADRRAETAALWCSREAGADGTPRDLAGFLRRTMAHHGTGRATQQSLSAPHVDGRSGGQRKKTIAEVDQTSDAQEWPR